MKAARPLVALALVMAALLATPAHADEGDSGQPSTQAQTTVNIQASKDNTLVQGDGSRSNGAGAHIFVGRVGGNTGTPKRRGVMAFDVAGNVPAGATIDSVTLTLELTRTRVSTAQTIALHKLSSDWGEGTSNAPFAVGGKGRASTSNDATWLHNFFSGSNWTSSGGDFSSTASGSRSVGGLGSYTWSSSQMETDVQGWFDNPSTNLRVDSCG